MKRKIHVYFVDYDRISVPSPDDLFFTKSAARAWAGHLMRTGEHGIRLVELVERPLRRKPRKQRAK